MNWNIDQRQSLNSHSLIIFCFMMSSTKMVEWNKLTKSVKGTICVCNVSDVISLYIIG